MYEDGGFGGGPIPGQDLKDDRHVVPPPGPARDTNDNRELRRREESRRERSGGDHSLSTYAQKVGGGA